MHGIANAGTGDHDETGVSVESADTALGVGKPLEHSVFRTRPEGERSGPGDPDLVMYSLRKYLRLAVEGDPTALLPLFAPAESVLTLTSLGEELRELGPSFLSQEAVHRFLGYKNAQRDRLPGVSTRKTPNRPELVAAHGYDVEYASHALRLAYQGLELVTTGALTLPMPEREQERVPRVKRGPFPTRPRCWPRSPTSNARARRRCRPPVRRTCPTWTRCRPGRRTPTCGTGRGDGRVHRRRARTPSSSRWISLSDSA